MLSDIHKSSFNNASFNMLVNAEGFTHLFHLSQLGGSPFLERIIVAQGTVVALKKDTEFEMFDPPAGFQGLQMSILSTVS